MREWHQGDARAASASLEAAINEIHQSQVQVVDNDESILQTAGLMAFYAETLWQSGDERQAIDVMKNAIETVLDAKDTFPTKPSNAMPLILKTSASSQQIQQQQLLLQQKRVHRAIQMAVKLSDWSRGFTERSFGSPSSSSSSSPLSAPRTSSSSSISSVLTTDGIFRERSRQLSSKTFSANELNNLAIQCLAFATYLLFAVARESPQPYIPRADYISTAERLGSLYAERNQHLMALPSLTWAAAALDSSRKFLPAIPAHINKQLQVVSKLEANEQDMDLVHFAMLTTRIGDSLVAVGQFDAASDWLQSGSQAISQWNGRNNGMFAKLTAMFKSTSEIDERVLAAETEVALLTGQAVAKEMKQDYKNARELYTNARELAHQRNVGHLVPHINNQLNRLKAVEQK
ncbi:hypothetical protein GQ42DRAFT_153586 [Ramicandelaber brevisporus]|nr:hypothetical protein GQ42DRAFT_153586 [Ramicandelaber brevisporus]